MDEASARAAFERYLSEMEKKLGQRLGIIEAASRRLSQGWAFAYQSQAYLETGELSAILVGQGPVIILNDGRILEGGSLHSTPEDVLRAFGVDV